MNTVLKQHPTKAAGCIEITNPLEIEIIDTILQF